MAKPVIILREYFLRLENEKESNDYHFYWLRHNCQCLNGCKHLQTKERIIDPTEISWEITPKFAEVVEVNQSAEEYQNSKWLLKIVWMEDSKGTQLHESIYSEEWLRTYAYSKNVPEIIKPHSSVDAVTVKYAEREPMLFLQILKKYGLLVVKGGPTTESGTLDITKEQFSTNLIETHFGLVEDLKTGNTTNKNNDQLGYTNAAVNIHTDQPFIEKPPSMQLLHCITPADLGGENQMVDGVAVAEYLRKTDSESFRILSTTPIKFHRKQKTFESTKLAPIIGLSNNGEIVQMRFSYFSMAPLDLPFDQTIPWYRAYNSFSKLVRDPRFQYQFLLQSGDYVIYDNHRMLHARSAFSGARHLRGIYLDREEVYARLSDPNTKFNK